MRTILRSFLFFETSASDKVKSLFAKTFKSLFLIFTCISCSYSSVTGQAGTALDFDGVNDHVTLPNVLPSGSYTKEAWVNSRTFGALTNNIVSGTISAFWMPNGNLSSGHNFNYITIQDPMAMITGQWYHVAVTYDDPTNTMILYKNGVQVATGNPTGTYTGELQQFIGAYNNGGGPGFFFDGQIDEVRIWNVALPVSSIRDWMCKILTPAHPQAANILAYYPSDEGSGTVLGDNSGNTNNGTLVNGTAWVTSGAAIGNASTHDYVNVTKTASITHIPSGQSLTVTSTSGSPDGIHVYRVDAVPDNVTGITGLGNNNKFFGVFQVGGTTPLYTADYFYNNTPTTDETTLRVFKRANNSSASWALSVELPNTATDIITITGESTEYILGSLGAPLPVFFTGFNLVKERNGTRLNWSTATETDNLGFAVQRSANGRTWSDLGFVNGMNNSQTANTYSYFDNSPAKGINYYRLKQIDINNNSKLSEVRSVTFASEYTIVYPVPTNDKIVIELKDTKLIGTRATLSDQQGRLIKVITITKMQQEVSLSALTPGFYMLKMDDGSVNKLVKQ